MSETTADTTGHVPFDSGSEEHRPIQGYRLESTEKFGVVAEHEDGSHTMGRNALANLARAALGKVEKPIDPDKRYGATFKHDDGSFDTGTRAVANGVRMVRGKEPKIYKRTYRPIR